MNVELIRQGLEYLTNDEFDKAGKLFLKVCPRINGSFVKENKYKIPLYHLAKSYFLKSEDLESKDKPYHSHREKASAILEDILIIDPNFGQASYLLAKVYDTNPNVPPDRIINILDKVSESDLFYKQSSEFKDELLFQKQIKKFIDANDGKPLKENDYFNLFGLTDKVYNFKHTSRFVSVLKDLAAVYNYFQTQLVEGDLVGDYNFVNQRLRVAQQTVATMIDDIKNSYKKKKFEKLSKNTGT